MDLFVGTVKGCGTGTLVLVGNENATSTGGTGTGTLVSGYGTGALRSVSGAFTGRGTVDAKGIRSTITGTIYCRK
jgi:hypothetical protein